MNHSVYEIGGLQLQLSSRLPWLLETSQNFTLQLSPKLSRTVDRWQVQYVTYDFLKDQIQTLTPRLLFDSRGSWAAYGPAAQPSIARAHGVADQVAPSSFDTITAFASENSLMLVDDIQRNVFYSWQSSPEFDDNICGFRFPLDELFFINAFSISQTLLIHSLSLLAHENGFLFCGVSGAGKSTLGQILENRRYRYLCDERNAIRRQQKIHTQATKTIKPQFQLESTPFHGTSEKAYAGSGPLAAIVILDPQHENLSLKKLSEAEATTLIYPTIFLPQYSKRKIELTLDTLQSVIENTPVFQLNYDKSKVDIADFLEKELFSPLSQA